MEELKYKCEACQFYTNAKSLWDKHIITEKHITGKRKIRCDKKVLDKCPDCDYTTKNNINMQQHILNIHSTREERKEKFKYYCEYCDFGNFIKSIYDNHLETAKHAQIIDIMNKK